MKKIWVWIVLAVTFFVGCASQKEYETVMDIHPQQEAPRLMEPVVNLPGDAVKQVLSSDASQQILFCDGYTLTLQILEGGDLEKTVKETTGFSLDQLQMIKTQQTNANKYSCAYSVAGEQGDQVCRCVILDDGNYHYVLTAAAAEGTSGKLSREVWQELFSSFRLIAQEDVVSSGS